jgi:hypothetical protein
MKPLGEKLPVAVLSGSLGAGETTLIDYVLSNRASRAPEIPSVMQVGCK